MALIIAVAGKGGVGKSTIAGLIITYLLRTGEKPVLALDADPDTNLGTILGIEVKQTIGDLREDVLKNIKKLPAGVSKFDYIEAGLYQTIIESNGFDFLAMGRSEGPGCYCYINSILRKFAEDVHPGYRWVVIDTEAGLEHISRRTTGMVDYLFVVVTKNPLSFDSAERIVKLAREVSDKIKHIYLIGNMMDFSDYESLKNFSAGLNVDIAGIIRKDEKLEEFMFRGKSIMDVPENFTCFEDIKKIVEFIRR